MCTVSVPSVSTLRPIRKNGAKSFIGNDISFVVADVTTSSYNNDQVAILRERVKIPTVIEVEPNVGIEMKMFLGPEYPPNVTWPEVAAVSPASLKIYVAEDGSNVV